MVVLDFNIFLLDFFLAGSAYISFLFALSTIFLATKSVLKIGGEVRWRFTNRHLLPSAPASSAAGGPPPEDEEKKKSKKKRKGKYAEPLEGGPLLFAKFLIVSVIMREMINMITRHGAVMLDCIFYYFVFVFLFIV